MAADDLLGKSQGAAHLADLVLKQTPQGLHQLELEVLGQAAHVVVALDLHGHPFTRLGIDVGASALDHIRIERALGQVIEGAKALALFFEDPNEFGANQLALFLGVGDAREFVDEALPGIDVFDPDVELLVEEVHQELGLTLPHEALVDEHAGQLITDRLVQQEGEGGGVDTTGEGEQDALIPDLTAHIGNRLIDKGRRGPIRKTTGDVIDEVADQGHSALGMHHLRVELNAIQTALVVGNRRLRRVVGVGQADKTLGQSLD